jgi:hypothetical protein
MDDEDHLNVNLAEVILIHRIFIWLALIII